MTNQEPSPTASVTIPTSLQPARISLSRKLLISCLVMGLLGGAVGSFLFVHYLAAAVPVSRQQIVVQESSAVVDVAKQTSPSVVSITTQVTTPVQSFFGLSGTTQQEGAGTGMILTSNGLILTNYHVIAGGTNITVFTSTGKQYKATVVASNVNQDYAFLRISASGLQPVKLGDSDAVQTGQQVVAIGNALGQYTNTVTEGIISGKGRPVTAGDTGNGSTETLADLFQTDAAINPGNSGGPLVTLTGEVIGMNTAVASDAQNIGFAIPINEIKTAISSVESKGQIQQPYLGVRYVPITPEYAAANNLSVTSGAYVTGDDTNPAVVPGSPADKAGLKSGDIITKVDSQAIGQEHSLTSILGAKHVGDQVKLTVLRGGKTITLTATLAQSPQ